MSELTVRAVGLAPLIEQGQDLGHLVGEQPVHRRRARRLVGQLATGPAADPPVGPPLGQLQHVADPTLRPAGIEGLPDQCEQPGRGGRVDPARNPAT